MAQCSVCKHIGANMRKCESCGNIWCQNCAMKGRGHYPKQTAARACLQTNSTKKAHCGNR